MQIEINTFSLAENRRFVYDLEKLKAWYVWFLRNNSSLDFTKIAKTHVRFYANAYRESDKQWQCWLDDFSEIYEVHGDNSDTVMLEDWVVRKDTFFIESNIVEEYEREWITPLEFSFGGFFYEFIPQYGIVDSPDFLTLHFRNYFYPDSPFKHLDKVKNGLRNLIVAAIAECPDVKFVQCGTWLNDVDAFIQLFPPVWAEHAVKGAPGGHMGWWGQFMDRWGKLHQRNSDYFRRTGEFPFKHYLCQCSVDELRDWLGDQNR